jgi:hypothetical protein
MQPVPAHPASSRYDPQSCRLAGEEVSRGQSCARSARPASPPFHAARKSWSDSLSVAFHGALRSRLTFCRLPTQKNPSPLRSSVFSSEFLLLPPRSALPAPPHAPARVLLRRRHALLLHACVCAESVRGCSAIHFQSSRIRQVRCNTFLSGCRLLWPPPCCLYSPTSLVVSVRPAEAPYPRSRFIPLRQSCLPEPAH